MLWIYAENDSFFEPALAKRMAERLRQGRRQGDVPAGRPNGRDGHSLASSSNGSSAWWTSGRSFLAGLK